MPNGDSNLELIFQDLTAKFGCHTFILYGSRARGDATEISDYDIIGIKNFGDGVIRDARLWKGYYLDAFIYPESKLVSLDEGMLRLRGGLVVTQRDEIGTLLLKRIEELYQAGPKKLTADEIQARRVWAKKMVERAKTGDAEGNFRRHLLLTALIEDYFVIRGWWYLGSKESFAWLKVNQPRIFEMYENALKPNSGVEALEDLVEEMDVNSRSF